MTPTRTLSCSSWPDEGRRGTEWPPVFYMTVEIYKNLSENSVIGKTKTLVYQAPCEIKGESSIINPVLILQYNEQLFASNYVYIPAWSRYYFIDDVRVLTGGRVEVSLSVDVLESFKDAILELDVILSDTEQTGLNNYLPSESFVVNCKHKTDIVNFSNGLLDNGEYILITAGG